MNQPEGHVVKGSEHLVCKLLKSLYGLKQASRAWQERLAEELAKLGYYPAPSEPSLFLPEEEGGVVLLVYVDDILLVGSLEAITRVKEELAQLFTVTDIGEATFFLGISITRDRITRTMTLSQGRYGLDVLDRFGMVDAKPVRTPLPSGFKFEEVKGDGAQETITPECRGRGPTLPSWWELLGDTWQHPRDTTVMVCSTS
jgi:hypothetical protein